MTNASYIAERFYDDLHERSETVGEITCPECKGEGETEYCMNCGNHHEECECDVKDLTAETCEKCNGGGTVEN